MRGIGCLGVAGVLSADNEGAIHEQTILLGREQEMLEIPQATWKQHLTQVPQLGQSRLNFMTDTHHQIRYFVVKEMANLQKPIEPEFISEQLRLPLEQVRPILEELERKLFFLVKTRCGYLGLSSNR
jgi:hypothetical protein